MSMDEADATALKGRAAVRALLIEPLQADGLVRPKGETLVQYHGFLDRLAEKLAYLPQPLLVTLREIVLNMARGALLNQWPSFASIWNTATRLMPPPDDARHIMVTWLASVEGPRAQAQGHLVELYGFLRRFGRPPSPHDMIDIRKRAADNASQRVRIQERIAAGRAWAGDEDWLARYTDAMAHCEALVAAGQAAREAKSVSDAGDVATGDAA